MALHLPSVSGLQRAVACAASTALPLGPERPPGAAAIRGTRIHAYIAAKLRGWELPDIGKTKVSHIDLDALRAYLGDGDIKCEAAFSYDGERVAYLGENIGREYGRPGTLCGSADIVVVRCHMMVLDVKTGSLPVPPPAENWQIATLAAMAQGASWPAIVEDVTGVIATLNRDGSWSFEAHTWNLDGLAAIRRRIDAARATWAEAHELEASGWGATPTPGAHCRWCRCACPHAETREEQAA
jgi:hypothetical protein